MSAPATSKHRSFPTIEFTDSEAGALEFPSSKSRKFNYYKPAKLRCFAGADIAILPVSFWDEELGPGWYQSKMGLVKLS